MARRTRARDKISGPSSDRQAAEPVSRPARPEPPHASRAARWQVFGLAGVAPSGRLLLAVASRAW
jgi:hypothetical protein